MKLLYTYLICLFGFLLSFGLFAQVEGDEIPQDSIPQLTTQNNFQEDFFKALSERGIENYSKAIEILSKIEKDTKNEPVVYFQLGLNYFDLEKFDKALENLDLAQNFKPDDLDIKEAIFKVYEQQKNYPKAVEYAQGLAKTKPEYHEILANIYLITQNYEKALLALDQADKILGYDANKDKLRELIYEASEKFDLAIDYYKNRRDYEPYNPIHNYRLIQFLMRSKAYEEALAESKKALESHPRFTRFYVLQTQVFLKVNQPQQSLSALKEVVTDRFLEETYKVEAIEYFKTYVETHPEVQDGFIQLLNLASNEAEDSASDLDLGLYYFESDKPKALNSFKKALEQNPQDFEILKRIAMLEYQLGNFENALQTAENALDIYPTQVVFMLVKAQVLMAQTQYNEAKSVLIEAQSYVFEENQNMLMLYESLSGVYEGLGETEKAMDYKNKADTLKSKLN